MIDPADPHRRLDEALAEGRRNGAVGPAPTREHLEQAYGFLAPGVITPGAVLVDLGSGGGLPALPLALAVPDTRWVLVEAWSRRAEALRRVVRRLELTGRVEVDARRAEDVGRSARRGTADVVTARAFAPPAVTLECAAPLLRPGGTLCVSVRDDEPVWPTEVLEELGYDELVAWRVGRFAYRAVRLGRACGDRWPRRPGVPERRPLF